MPRYAGALTYVGFCVYPQLCGWQPGGDSMRREDEVRAVDGVAERLCARFANLPSEIVVSIVKDIYFVVASPVRAAHRRAQNRPLAHRRDGH